MIYNPYQHKGNKYGRTRPVIDGHTFDSKREATFYQELLLRQRAGEIEGFELQPEYVLQDKFRKNGKAYRAIKYRADFLIKYPDGREEIVDCKGVKTEAFKIKQKMFEKRYPDKTITLT